jgi:hypothetical protein
VRSRCSIFDVQGSVAKSTHSGIPWLRFIRQRLGPRVHFWPFDGWDIPPGRSAIAEVYPALWSRASREPTGRPNSTTPSASPPGCLAPIGMASLQLPSTCHLSRPNAHERRSRGGSWASAPPSAQRWRVPSRERTRHIIEAAEGLPRALKYSLSVHAARPPALSKHAELRSGFPNHFSDLEEAY